MKHFRQILYINIGVFSMLLMFAGCQNSPQNQQADNVVRKDTMKTVAKMDSEMQLEMERAVILDYVQNIFRVVNDDQRTITFEDFEVTKLVMDEKEKSASVSFVVCEYNDDVPARVDLVYEDGRWVIDNFYDLRYMLNLRHCMWNYLNNDFI